MGKLTKALLITAIILVASVFTFGLLQSQRTFDRRMADLNQKLTAYDTRKDSLALQQAALEEAQLQLALHIKREQEATRQEELRKSIVEQNTEVQRQAALLEAQRQAKLEAARIEAARIKAARLAEQRARALATARTTRAS